MKLKDELLAVQGLIFRVDDNPSYFVWKDKVLAIIKTYQREDLKLEFENLDDEDAKAMAVAFNELVGGQKLNTQSFLNNDNVRIFTKQKNWLNKTIKEL